MANLSSISIVTGYVQILMLWEYSYFVRQTGEVKVNRVDIFSLTAYDFIISFVTTWLIKSKQQLFIEYPPYASKCWGHENCNQLIWFNIWIQFL